MALVLHARSQPHSAWNDTGPSRVEAPRRRYREEMQPCLVAGSNLAPEGGGWCGDLGHLSGGMGGGHQWKET